MSLETLIFTVLPCIVYAVLMVFSLEGLLKDRPRPSFWRMALAMLFGPLVMAISLLGKAALYGGATLITCMNMLTDKVVPPKRIGPYEDRLDLH